MSDRTVSQVGEKQTPDTGTNLPLMSTQNPIHQGSLSHQGNLSGPPQDINGIQSRIVTRNLYNGNLS